MSEPNYYKIAYEINPWMHVDDPVDHKKALAQWHVLFDAYKQLGVAIELIDQVNGLPDMTFVANGGIVQGNTFVSGNPQPQERRGESVYFQNWFSSHGFTVTTVSHHFSGEGDALWYRDVLYMGYGFRSELAAHAEVSTILKVKTVSLHLVNPNFYDFDMCFCPIGNRGLLYYPEAFDAPSKDILSHLPNAHAFTQQQARNFVGNSVLVGDTMLVSYVDDELRRIFDTIGVTPQVLDMSEFKKGGGGIKCLTLILEKGDN